MKRARCVAYFKQENRFKEEREREGGGGKEREGEKDRERERERENGLNEYSTLSVTRVNCKLPGRSSFIDNARSDEVHFLAYGMM